MGRAKRFKTAEELESAWKAYKADCDNQLVLTHEFSAKSSRFVSKKLKRPITYSIEGFCVFIGMSRQSFYQTYAGDKKYVDIVTRIREECEVDARKKFELEMVPSQLAGLWMSKYGYRTKTENKVDGGVQVVIHDDLED